MNAAGHESAARLIVRALEPRDRAAWEVLWAGYNAFYDRAGGTALPATVTDTTWRRFLDPAEAMFALVAEDAGHVVGLAHFLFHRSTTRMEPVCYLQDLFTSPALRGRGVGRALIEGVHARARQAGAQRLYWQTRENNVAGRALYDKVAQHHGFIVYSRDA
jgi:GNAT superfamily N-acetyltransferase